MGKARSDSGYYWVDKKLTCNGCKYLNFYKAGCRRNQPPGQVRHLPTYTNGDDYIAVLRPPDCDYQKEQKPTEQVSTEGKHASLYIASVPWRCSPMAFTFLLLYPYRKICLPID